MLIISGKYFEPGQHPSEQEASEMNKETYDANSVYYTRLYAMAGLSYRVGSRWLIGINYRKGVGAQFIEGGNTNFIYKIGVFMLSAKYQIRL